MNAEQMITEALKERTLPEALSFVAICEMERLKPAIEAKQPYETCFKYLFRQVLDRYVEG